MFLHLSRSLILTCRDSMFKSIWDTISRWFSRTFNFWTIFWISVKHSTFTSQRSSCYSGIFSLRGSMLFSTFLLLFISSRKLMISSFNLVFSYFACKSFLFNIVTLWAVDWVRDANYVSTVIGSSIIFSKKTSSSWISFIVPSFCFTLWILFQHTSFW